MQTELRHTSSPIMEAFHDLQEHFAGGTDEDRERLNTLEAVLQTSGIELVKVLPELTTTTN
jgi:hypothetical protein